MIIDTDTYNANDLAMFFEVLSKRLKTKKQYADSNPISRKGVDKRLKSAYSPQKYVLCGITLIEDKTEMAEEIKPLPLKKYESPF